jgi:dynein heavy chain
MLAHTHSHTAGFVLQEGGAYVPKHIRRLQYFSRPSDAPAPTLHTIADTVQFGVIAVPPLDALLSVMNGVFLPTFLANQSWPESTRREFTGQLHKFMASLTESVHQLRKHTVLYLPDEKQLQAPNYLEVAKKDKDLVQRLETTLIHWTRQIKEVVSNQESTEAAAAAAAAGTGSGSGGGGGGGGAGGGGGGAASGSGGGPPTPLDEIAYWQSRTLDLSGIRAQLDRAGVKQIVAVLTAAGSTYLQQFNNLSQTIQLGSVEANNNLMFLSTLHEPCTRLQNTKDIPSVLPEILRLIRMIWTISKVRPGAGHSALCVGHD